MGGTLRSLVRDVVAWAGELAVFVLVAALVISNRLVPISSTFLQAEFDLLKRPVSGKILLVQVDSRSVQEMGAGPLPRRSIAKVLDVLKDAGAAAVWLDIDVQPAPQNANPDALQREIAAAGDTIVLASGAWTKRSELPLSQLAAFLQVEQGVPLRRFTVDGMINHREVPSLSLLDVYDANFNLEAVKGKRVIVAADPISAGLLVAASESVLQGRMLFRAAPWSGLVIAAATVLFLRPRSRAWCVEDVLVPSAGVVIGLGSLAALVLQHSTLIVDPVPGFAAAAGFVVWMALLEFVRQASRAISSPRRNAGRPTLVEAIVDEAKEPEGRPHETPHGKRH